MGCRLFSSVLTYLFRSPGVHNLRLSVNLLQSSSLTATRARSALRFEQHFLVSAPSVRYYPYRLGLLSRPCLINNYCSLHPCYPCFILQPLLFQLSPILNISRDEFFSYFLGLRDWPHCTITVIFGLQEVMYFDDMCDEKVTKNPTVAHLGQRNICCSADYSLQLHMANIVGCEAAQQYLQPCIIT